MLTSLKLNANSLGLLSQPAVAGVESLGELQNLKPRRLRGEGEIAKASSPLAGS